MMKLSVMVVAALLACGGGDKNQLVEIQRAP